MADHFKASPNQTTKMAERDLSFLGFRKNKAPPTMQYNIPKMYFGINWLKPNTSETVINTMTTAVTIKKDLWRGFKFSELDGSTEANIEAKAKT